MYLAARGRLRGCALRPVVPEVQRRGVDPARQEARRHQVRDVQRGVDEQPQERRRLAGGLLLYHIVYYIILHYIMICNIILYYITLYYIILHYISLYFII